MHLLVVWYLVNLQDARCNNKGTASSFTSVIMYCSCKETVLMHTTIYEMSLYFIFKSFNLISFWSMLYYVLCYTNTSLQTSVSSVQRKRIKEQRLLYFSIVYFTTKPSERQILWIINNFYIVQTRKIIKTRNTVVTSWVQAILAWNWLTDSRKYICIRSFHIRTVHLDTMKLSFIHQLMH